MIRSHSYDDVKWEEIMIQSNGVPLYLSMPLQLVFFQRFPAEDPSTLFPFNGSPPGTRQLYYFQRFPAGAPLTFPFPTVPRHTPFAWIIPAGPRRGEPIPRSPRNGAGRPYKKFPAQRGGGTGIF